ncbi:hypothetical protein [Pseudemcibacter aquimaris]|uniref:hypothetical protein n=1 Tax=Pseudemcibacter aquimaris TaxID=2857064 RepID=UPI002012A58D|nr:hypothetical protein [Pseudemcibacter aquimaris]MCC3859781.1 hypothetical protein [Pseudemcibacter aquimaris]WDU60175.1 hypothetical protein KW060_07880 [Pseudemcibacter aquimaris]
MAYKPKSWPHGLISIVVMALFYFVIPELPKIVYAALLPIMYYYGREVLGAEPQVGWITGIKKLDALWPPNWPDRDNRMDFYQPIIWCFIFGILIKFIELSI